MPRCAAAPTAPGWWLTSGALTGRRSMGSVSASLASSRTGTRSRSVRPLSASRRAGLPEVADPAQRFLEYVFLALLYLFFLRVVRAVWVELREPRLVPAPGPSGSPPQAARAASGTPKGRNVPRELAVIGPEEGKGQAFPLAEEISI